MERQKQTECERQNGWETTHKGRVELSVFVLVSLFVFHFVRYNVSHMFFVVIMCVVRWLGYHIYSWMCFCFRMELLLSNVWFGARGTWTRLG